MHLGVDSLYHNIFAVLNLDSDLEHHWEGHKENGLNVSAS